MRLEGCNESVRASILRDGRAKERGLLQDEVVGNWPCHEGTCEAWFLPLRRPPRRRASDVRPRQPDGQEGEMSDTAITASQPWYSGLNRAQWNTLLAANLGWLF